MAGNDETIDMNALGEEGDVCAACGSPLAVDQRYCLNCGEARTEPRLDFQKHVGTPSEGAAAPVQAPGAASGPAAAISANNYWNPIAAVGLIAVLGVMLLLGVLIGKEDTQQVAAAPATTTTTADPAAAAPTDTTAADAAAAKPDKAAKAAAAAATKASGGGIQGGSGSTEGISTENPLEGKTGEELQEASKNSPDVVATSSPSS